MLAFDPNDRITVPEALEHPWLASYHDETDEPDCSEKFEKWRKIEELETLDEFREAIWNEIENYRREVRGGNLDLSGLAFHAGEGVSGSGYRINDDQEPHELIPSVLEPDGMSKAPTTETEATTLELAGIDVKELDERLVPPPSTSPDNHRRPQPVTPTDPVVTYARRSSILQPSRQGSTFNSPLPTMQHLPPFSEGPLNSEPGSLGPGSVVFPSQGYIVPARSRTGSVAGGGEVTRKLLRTLSTVSIHESVEGLAGGLAGIAPIGKYIVERQTTEADAPASEMPMDFGIDETSEGEEDGGHGGSNIAEEETKEKKEGRFRLR